MDGISSAGFCRCRWTIVILIFFLFEDLFLFLLRPLFRTLGRLAPFVALGARLKRLPPYVALVIFIIPFVLLEPPKIFSVFLIGTGHFVSGTIMLIVSYILSLFIVERMFHVTRDQLLSIAWFARGFHLVMKIKGWAFEQMKSSAIWRWSRPLARWISATAKATLTWLWGHVQRVTQPGR